MHRQGGRGRRVRLIGGTRAVNKLVGGEPKRPSRLMLAVGLRTRLLGIMLWHPVSMPPTCIASAARCSAAGKPASLSRQPEMEQKKPRVRERRISADRSAFTVALDECRATLDTRLVALGGNWSDGHSSEEVRKAVRQLASKANGFNIPPERMIAVFKDMLKSLPAVDRSDPGSRSEITRQLVQVAIEAYYPQGRRPSPTR
jgi:hypothetical protein